MTAMDILESLSTEDQNQFQMEYGAYVKSSTKYGLDVMTPEEWLAKHAAIAPKLHKPVYQTNPKITRKFKEIMIEAGHGSCVERAVFFVKGI